MSNRLWLAIRDGLTRTRRSPRLSVAAVLCIALGMAATAAVATLISLTTFRPLPFPDAERLVRIWNTEGDVAQRDSLAWLDFQDLSAMETLDALEAAVRSRLVWQLPDRAARRVEGEAISGGYLSLLDVRPYIGRTFTAEEYASGEPLMLLSHAAWGREFNYDPNILGTGIRTSTQGQGITKTYTVIGVLPPDFHGTIEDDMPDLEYWVPAQSYLVPELEAQRDLRGVLVVGRLAAGASLAAAQAEASAMAATLAPEFAQLFSNHDFRVERLGADWREGYGEANQLLSMAAGLLLLVAVLNVAMLLLARATERRHELALRSALGAGGWQLVLPVLAETIVLALLGGALGLLLAGPLLTGFLSLSGSQIPTYLDVRPDRLTLAVSFLAMLIAGLIAAVLPAGAATRINVNEALREGSGKLIGTRSAGRWGRWMVGGQIALTLTLLLAGALLGRSYLELQNRSLGFATDHRLRMGLFVNPADVPDEAGLPPFIEEVEAALRAHPGVRDVALLWPTVPLVAPINGRLQWPQMPEGQRDPGLLVSNYIVDDGFFAGLDMPLVSGRTFDSRDADAQLRTALVSRSLADQFGGPTAALERQVTLNGNAYRIVGVVGDAMFGGPRESADFRHQMYLSYAQLPRRIVSPIIEVDGDPAAFAEPLKQVLARVAPNSAVDWVEPVDEFIAWLYRDSAFRLVLVAAFAISALLLAAVGLYAVLAQQVSAATAEIGIRKALGASDRRILARVVSRGLSVALAGVGVGVLLSLGFSRVLSGLLYGVAALDPLAYLVAAGLLLLVALVSCLLPGLRAAQVQPTEALRYQ